MTAGFAEHDEQLGSSASVEARRDTGPGPAEAEELLWPAVWAETVRRLGEGDWRPSLYWLDVVEVPNSQEARRFPRPRTTHPDNNEGA